MATSSGDDGCEMDDRSNVTKRGAPGIGVANVAVHEVEIHPAPHPQERGDGAVQQRIEHANAMTALEQFIYDGVGRAGDDRGEASGRILMMGHQRLEGADVTLFCSVDQLGFRPSSTPRPPDRFP